MHYHCDDYYYYYCLFVVSLQDVAMSRERQQAQAQEYLRVALRLLGLQHCLDFMESSEWPWNTITN